MRGFGGKSEGASSLSRSRPLLSDLSKTRFGPGHSRLPFQNRSGPASGARASHPVSVITNALQELSWVPSVGSRFPGCLRESRFRFSFQVLSPAPLRGPLPVPLGFFPRAPLRDPLPVPGVPFLAPLRAPLPVLLKSLPRLSCEHRFRFSDGSCLLSSSGGLLLC